LGDFPRQTLERVTALPASAPDGYELIYVADGSNDIEWHLKYNNGTSKWRFIGGLPLRAEVATNESTSSTSYADLATVGPSITVPLTGDYRVFFGFLSHNSVAGQLSLGTLKIGGADQGDSAAARHRANAATTTEDAAWRDETYNISGGNAVVMWYKASGNTSNFYNRVLTIWPVRF